MPGEKRLSIHPVRAAPAVTRPSHFGEHVGSGSCPVRLERGRSEQNEEVYALLCEASQPEVQVGGLSELGGETLRLHTPVSTHWNVNQAILQLPAEQRIEERVVTGSVPPRADGDAIPGTIVQSHPDGPGCRIANRMHVVGRRVG